ncbi:MAG: response regulator transcription factor [Firmicutes bacterium]|nr:response regulator transcription factor [Bacillota bacterium]
MLNYLAIEKDEAVHNRESAAWALRSVGSVRVRTMNEGVKKAAAGKYLFIIINSTNINYLSKLRLLREVTNDPIIIGTNKYSPMEHSKALSMGADSYAQISDTPQENVDSVLALLGRLEERSGKPNNAIKVISYGDILIAREQRKAFIGEKELSLNKDETNIFYYLLCNYNRILTYQQIFDFTRGEDSERMPNNAVRSAMKRLRKKIEAAGFSKNLIENVRGLGYRIATLN